MKHYSLARSATVLFVALLLLPALKGGAYAQLIGGTVSRSGPAPGEEYTALAIGFFVYSKTDLSLPGPMPIDITRVYRSSDVTSGTWNNRDFGVGASLNYDIFLYSNSEANSKKNDLIYTDAEVVMPDGGMIECLRSDSNPSSDYINATFACNQQPTGVWFGSTITFNASGNNWDLKRPDGTTYTFGYNSPLQSITDRYGNSITITRGPVAENSACQGPAPGGEGSVPAGSVAIVSSSNGRKVYFCYDDSNNPTDITGIADNASPTIKQVFYTYDSKHRLSTATQYAFNSNATTTYQWNQGSSAGVGDITTIIVNDSCAGTNCGNPNQVYTYMTYGINALGTVLKSISSQLPGNGYTYTYTIPNGWNNASEVQVSLPDGANRYFYFDQAGYVIEDARNVGLQSVSPEYTYFDRGQQTIGTSGDATGTTEFIGKVQEEDSNNNVLRTTTYNYDTSTGNLLTIALSPAPGQTSGTATWTNTYTTYNRIASAAEPYSYNGIGTAYSYNDTPSQPVITVTDPLGRITTITENPQGQPISVKDPMGYTSTAVYTSAGDLQSVTDPIGNMTTFQPDADGRTKTVTSPLGESSTYKYDALDDITDSYDPLGNHTNYTYDLIGGEASVTTPNGNTTTISNSSSLATTTVTDPNGKTTITNLDGQGRHTDYTDKRGVKTTYGYDRYGRPTTVLFDANSQPGYSQIEVTFSNYDALDRAGEISESPGSTLYYTYDSWDNIWAETQPSGPNGANETFYGYDPNGRRTGTELELNGVAYAQTNYGYDCADELIAASNNGSIPPSCSPSNSVTNGSTNTQVGIIYDSDGMPTTTVVDGIETLFTRDSDERVTAQTFQPIATGTPYGNLTYQYNPDGHMVDEGGSLAAVTMPQNETETFSKTDQLLTWNVYAVASDSTQTNISGDPSTGLCYTWDSRNQLTGMGGCITPNILETYDPIARRQVASSPTDSLSFLYDGGGVAGWVDSPSGNLWTFMTAGGAALAGSYTSGGTTTTWVPLTDINGSTIGLVNPALPTSPPGATYTYDPSGNVSVNGSNVTSWPFQYQGMEHEITDPANLYFNSSSNVYNPQIQNMLSQVGAQGLGGGSGGSGSSGGGGGSGLSGGGSGGGSNPFSLQTNAENGAKSIGVGVGAAVLTSVGEQTIESILEVSIASSWAGPVGWVAGALYDLASFLDDLFGGGGGSPPIPRQLMHKRHPLYGEILKIDSGIIPTEFSDGKPEFCGDPQNCNKPPLQKPPMPEAPKKTPSIASKYQACLSKNLYSGPNSPIIPMCVGVGGLCIATLGEPVLCLPSGSACMALVGIKHCCQQIARGKGSRICLQILEPPIP